MLKVVILLIFFNILYVNTEKRPDILLQFNEVESLPKCNNEDSFHFLEGDKVLVKTVTDNFDVVGVSCIRDKGKAEIQLLEKKDFEGKCNETCRPTKRYINITSSMHGEWNCTFDVQLHPIAQPQAPKIIYCTFNINVTSSRKDTKPGLSSPEVIMIGVGVGLVVGAVIIAQTIAVCHFKAKAKSEAAKRRLEEIPLERRGKSDRKPRVYSTLPWQKRKNRVKKLQEDDTRSTSGVYEDVSPVLSIKSRPPMPLPVEIEYEDPEKIVGDRKGKDPVPLTATPPELPGIDTLPRAKPKPKNLVKSKQSLAAETTSRPVSPKVIRLPPLPQNTANSRPRSKARDDIRIPDRRGKEPEPSTATPPGLPEIETLSRAKPEAKKLARSNQSFATETPPSLDSPKVPVLPPRSPNTANSRSRPKVKDDTRNPGVSPPIVDELHNVLKKRNESLVNSPPTTKTLSTLSNSKQTLISPEPKQKQGVTKHPQASVPPPALSRREKPKPYVELAKPSPKPGSKPPPPLPKPKPGPSRKEVCKPSSSEANVADGSSYSDDENEWTYEALSSFNLYHM